ncbi:acyl carrier protein [Nonomuraea solani]|uniref:Acyl carrier protein n=1 Tax=Nonomuraea solani TaxID=1144553 RepID=A0A1H5Y6W1_9ACTN|nr:acyl carrier protein [Nonomuraea solani]SEG19721.1 acyl carrier protein [Nonomuraea solani]
MANAYEQLHEVLVTKFNVSSDDLQPETTFEALDLDSLAIVEVAVSLQERLGVPIEEEEFATPETTLRQAADQVDAKANGTGEGAVT